MICCLARAPFSPRIGRHDSYLYGSTFTSHYHKHPPFCCL